MTTTKSDPPFPFRAVIFDVDGTLIKDGIHRDKYDDIQSRFGPRGLPKLLDRDWSLIRGKCDADCYRFMAKRSKALGFDLGVLTEATYLELAQSYMRTHVKFLTMREGAKEALELLRAKGVVLGIATNADAEETFAKLRAVRLWQSFSLLSTLDGDLRPKPHPDLYLDAITKADRWLYDRFIPTKAHDRYRALRNAEVLVVEDTVVGATAALVAGCTVIWWPDPAETSTAFEGEVRIRRAKSPEHLIALLQRPRALNPRLVAQTEATKLTVPVPTIPGLSQARKFKRVASPH